MFERACAGVYREVADAAEVRERISDLVAAVCDERATGAFLGPITLSRSRRASTRTLFERENAANALCRFAELADLRNVVRNCDRLLPADVSSRRPHPQRETI